MATPNPHATVLSGKFGFGPQDVYTAYDLNSVISGGTTGSGVTIAIVLTRQALQSDLNNFDQRFGLPSTSLNRTFLAGTCSSPCPQPTGQSDINEAATDTEWAHAAAPGATIDTISVGDVLNTSLVLGMEYVVDQLGSAVQIASTSFGVCEAGLQPFDAQAYAALVDQGVPGGADVVRGVRRLRSGRLLRAGRQRKRYCARDGYASFGPRCRRGGRHVDGAARHER